MNENKPIIKSDWIDEEDAPELTDEFFEQADEYRNGVLVKHCQTSMPNNNGFMRLDPDIIAAFKATGDDWQTRINAVLREWVLSHPSS